MPVLEIDLELPQTTEREDLENGYQVVKKDQLPGLELFNKEFFKREVSEDALYQALRADVYLKSSEEIAGGTAFQTAVDRSNDRIDRFLLALNVNERLWTFRRDVRFSWLDDNSRGQLSNRHFWPLSTVEDSPTMEDFSRAAKLSVTIDTVYSGEPQEHYPAVRTAFDALRLGSYAFSTSVRFLQEAIALEALCSASDTEVTHRVATTCAILVGTRPEQRKTVYQEAKRLYGIRSRIIHGSGNRATVQELKDIEQLTRKILRRILQDDVFPSYKTRPMQSDFLLRLALEKNQSGDAAVSGGELR